MKKLFLLPLMVLLCLGCSKDAVQDAGVDLARQETKSAVQASPLEVTFHHQMSSTWGFRSSSYVEYTDENGVLQTVYPTPETLSYQIRVAGNGYITIHVDIAGPFDMIYAAILTDIRKISDGEDVYFRNLTNAPPVMGTYTIPASIFNNPEVDPESTHVNIFLRADENEEMVFPQ